MHRRPLRRATILALTGLLAFAGTAMADQLLADGDVLTPQVEGTRPLGNVPAGGEVSVDVRFVLTCTGLGHVDVGQTVLIDWAGGGSTPPGGEIVSVTSATIGPITDGWAADTQGCPDPVPTVEGNAFSHVTLRAPTTPANGYMYTVIYARSLSPANDSDGSAFSRTATQVSFTLNVVGNTPPSLTVPASFTVEGNTTGGWTADWSGVSATDVEDDPDPTPTCSPAAGSVLPLDTTHVSCSVTDSGGATTSGAFDVTVEDTTAPVLAGMPSDQSVTTGDPAGAVVTYQSPTATDIVDPSPSVACSPPSGETFAVGTTTVTCTATDASGRSSSASFTVEVRFVAPQNATAIWLEPVRDGQGSFEANHSRTIPVKVRLFVDGVERTSGQALLTLTPCDDGPTALELTMSWGGGRWNASLDTSRLSGACYTVTASIDGIDAGSFRLELRGDPVATKTPSSQPASTLPVKAGHTKAR